MTYPLYLLHEAVGGVTFGAIRRLGFEQPVAASAGFIVSLAASYVVVVSFEPFLRRRLVGLLHPLLARIVTLPVAGRCLGAFTAKPRTA